MGRCVHVEWQGFCLACVVLARSAFTAAFTAAFATGCAFATAFRATFTTRCVIAGFTVLVRAGFFAALFPACVSTLLAALFTRHAFVAGFAAGFGLRFGAGVV